VSWLRERVVGGVVLSSGLPLEETVVAGEERLLSGLAIEPYDDLGPNVIVWPISGVPRLPISFESRPSSEEALEAVRARYAEANLDAGVEGEAICREGEEGAAVLFDGLRDIVIVGESGAEPARRCSRRLEGEFVPPLIIGDPLRGEPVLGDPFLEDQTMGDGGDREASKEASLAPIITVSRSSCSSRSRPSTSLRRRVSASSFARSSSSTASRARVSQVCRLRTSSSSLSA
jgi:hypothetical protein